MHSQRILLPVDLKRGTTDTLLHLQRMACEAPCCAVLLYVVELNIIPPNESIYLDLRREAEIALSRLATFFFGDPKAVAQCVRFGRADEQIIAQAAQSDTDLILMSKSRTRPWYSPCASRVVDRVVRYAPCPTLVLQPSAAPDRTKVPLPKDIRRPSRALPHPTWVEA